MATSDGILTYCEEHDRDQVVDDGNFAVSIKDYDDEDDLEELTGQRVRVSGVFNYEDDFGVFIEADIVEAVPDATPESSPDPSAE